MEFLDPLAVDDVGLAPRDVLHMTGVHENNLQATCLEDVVDRDPINTRSLHRHGFDSAGLEPVGQAVQIRGLRLESAYRFRIPIGGNGHVVVRRPAVDSGGIRIDPRQHRRRKPLGLFRFGTLASIAIVFHRMLLHTGIVVEHPGTGCG